MSGRRAWAYVAAVGLAAVVIVTAGGVAGTAAELPRPRSIGQQQGYWGGGATGMAACTGARFGRHPGYDRMVLDLTPPGTRSGTFYSDSGFPPGTAAYRAWYLNDTTLRVKVWSVRIDPPWFFRYTPNLPEVKGVLVTQDSGDGLEVDVTVAASSGFRIFALSAPDRVVVDIAHGRAGGWTTRTSSTATSG